MAPKVSHDHYTNGPNDALKRRIRSLEKISVTVSAAIGRYYQRHLPSPYQRIARNGRKVVQRERGHTIPKGRAVAVQRIRGQPARWHAATHHRLAQQVECHLRFGFALKRRRQLGRLAFVGMRLTKPQLGKKPLAIEQGVALTTGIAEIDAKLSVSDFADRAAVLGRNTDTVVALFDDTGFVDQEGPIFLAERRANQQLMLGNNGLNRPGALADKVLQGADRHPQMQGP